MYRSIQLVIIAFFAWSFTLSGQTDFEDILWTVDWSPNGKYIAVGGNQDSLKIYSKNLELIKSYPFEGLTITCLKWHPTKNILAIATQMSGAKVGLLNFDTNEIIELDSIPDFGARGIGWNHTGEYLAVVDNEGQISFHTVNGEFIRIVKRPKAKSYTALDWHPSQNLLIAVGEQVDVVDLDGNFVHSFTHRSEAVLLLCVEWHPAGVIFAIGDYGDYDHNYPPLLQIWHADYSLINEVEVSKAEYRNLAWIIDGNLLATASDALRIHYYRGDLVSENSSDSKLWGVDFNPKGNRIVTCSEAGLVQIWNLKGKLIRSVP